MLIEKAIDVDQEAQKRYLEIKLEPPAQIRKERRWIQ